MKTRRSQIRKKHTRRPSPEGMGKKKPRGPFACLVGKLHPSDFIAKPADRASEELKVQVIRGMLLGEKVEMERLLEINKMTYALTPDRIKYLEQYVAQSETKPVQIPEQLKDWRFIKVQRKEKKAIEHDWPRTANYEYNAPELLEHIAAGGNYGVMGDASHVIIDGDVAEVQAAVEEHLPETFTVETPGHKGKHYYYCAEMPAPIRLNREGKNVGELAGRGKYTVGPSCTHPDGGIYRIINPSPCAKVTGEQIREALSEFIAPEPEAVDWEKHERKSDLPITSIHPVEGMRRQGNEYYGVHPVHGSDTGHNFWINVEKNVWHCFRHNTGGGPLSLLAVKEGILKCEEARPGALRGDAFKQTKTKLQEKGLTAKARAEEPLVVETPWAELKDGRLLEECYDGQKVYYSVFNPKDQSMVKADFIFEEETKTRYEPIMNKDVETFQVLFPVEPNEYGSDEALFEESKAYMDRWHGERDRRSRAVDVAYVFLTHLYPLMPQIPNRRYLGPFGKGKTRRMTVAGSICYRPFFIAGCDSEPSLRRTFDCWRGTANLDEADFGRSDMYACIMKILNIGFDKVLGWYRCCDENDPKKILSFYVYGPKIIATRKRWKDLALESRCITDFCQEPLKPMPLYLAEKFFKEALQLRNKMLTWRFRNYHRFKEKMHDLEGTEIIKETYGEDSKISTRIQQITLPLTLVSPGLSETIKEIAVEHDEVLKSLDEDAILEERLKEAVQALVKSIKLVKVTMGGRGVIIKLRDIAQTISGTEDPDVIKETSKKLAPLIRTRTKWLVKVGHGNLREVHIPLEVRAPHVVLTQLIDLTKAGAIDLDKCVTPEDIKGEGGVEVIFPHKVALRVTKKATEKEAELGLVLGAPEGSVAWLRH